MPKLRKYVDGSGYYLSDYLHGVGYCTWQIGDEGRGYLSERGIKEAGDHVSARDRTELLDKGWIWVTGACPDRLPPGALVLPPDLRPLAEDLTKWAGRGSFESLQDVLYRRHGDQRGRCFSTQFLKWLADLDSGLELSDLDAVSAPDFEDAARPVIERLKEPLHSFFVRRGETHVLWQLSRAVALVARHARDHKQCPPLWKARYQAFEWLFARIRELSSTSFKKTRRWRPRRLACPPRIVWEVEMQHIVASLPAQALPAECRGIGWRINPGVELEQPQVWTEADGKRIEETRSRALSPASVYTIETELYGEPSFAIERMRLELPDSLAPCVLFTTYGEMLGADGESILPPGEYLALVKRDLSERLFKLPGVRQGERIDIGPVGWHGWQGWRLHLEPDAEVAPYVVDADSASVTWEVEPPADTEVRLRETLPVYFGRWPKVFVTNPDSLLGAIIEIGREPALLADQFLTVGEANGVSVRIEGKRSFLDFDAVKALRTYFGAIRVTCRLPMQPDARPLTARFIRLPQLTMAYVPDPICPDEALAVRLQANPETVANLVADADTEMQHDSNGVVLRAKTPHASPGISASLRGQNARIRVRIPATRLGVATLADGFLGWQQPPLDDLDLSAIESSDRLRVELHLEPELEEDRLLCRIIGGEEVAAGWLIGSGGPVWQFEIELHRWRDSFGPTTGGMIQVRTCNKWMDIVRLRETQSPPLPPPEPPKPLSKRARLIAALEESLVRDDRIAVRREVTKCLAHLGDATATTVDRELLSLAIARAHTAATASADDLLVAQQVLDGLGERGDLPEVEIMRRVVSLRQTYRVGNRLAVDDLDRLYQGLADLSQSLLFRAECRYRFCRRAQVPAGGSWQTCHDLCARHLAKIGVPAYERGAALLLRAVARLMLGLEADSAPIAPTQAPVDVWLAGLRLAVQSVRSPRYRVAKDSLPTLPDGDISILCHEDIALVRIAVAHAAGRPADEEHFACLSEWGREQFFAMNLLRGRQARFKGDETEARKCYDRLQQEALAMGPDFLLDVEAGER